MKLSHKLFSLLALVSLIQVSFAMGGRPPVAYDPNGSQNDEAKIRITNNEKLEFLDSKGQSRDQISLGTEKVLKPENKAQIVTRNAMASKDGSRALLIESKGPEFVDVTPSDTEANDTPKETSHLKVLDKTGNIIWQKQLPEDRLTTSADFSADGKTLGTIQIWTNYTNAHREEPVEQLVVYDESGKIVFKFPENKNSYRLRSGIRASQTGKYIAIRATKDHPTKYSKIPTLLIFEVPTGLFFEKETRGFVYQISDDGTATFYERGGHSEELNFKKEMRNISGK